MLNFIKGLGLGAGVMYLMDPERGEDRRQAMTEGVKETTQGVNEWLSHAMTDSVPNTVGLAAAAMGGLVGLKFFARRPLTTLALAAAGFAIARQLQAQHMLTGFRPTGLDPKAAASGAYRDASMDLAEMSHYGNAGNGHSGGKRSNGPGPATA
ncbi:MAG: hypothetical protein U0794_09490 [Isosphaeraceae bacterium]